jgi:hypothetical protein
LFALSSMSSAALIVSSILWYSIKKLVMLYLGPTFLLILALMLSLLAVLYRNG